MPIRTRIHRLELRLAPSQQDMWATLREQGVLRTNELSGREDDIRACSTYLKRLVKAGIAEQLPGTGRIGTPLVVRLINDQGPIAPALTDGGKASRRGRVSDQMWRTIRMHKQIDCRDLAIYASTEGVPVAPVIAQQYLIALHRAGYLHLVEPGRPRHPARYRLIPSKNSGPRAPRIIQMRGVYDDNLGRLIHADEVRDAG